MSVFEELDKKIVLLDMKKNIFEF